MQTLEQAVSVARNGSVRNIAICAFALEGLPEGGWGETQQAIRQIADLLPLRSERSYTTAEFISALYVIDHAGRYRSKIWLERAEQKRTQIEQAQRQALTVPALDIKASPERSVSVCLDREGYICTSGGTWEEIADRVPAEWIARAKTVRAGIVGAQGD